MLLLGRAAGDRAAGPVGAATRLSAHGRCWPCCWLPCLLSLLLVSVPESLLVVMLVDAAVLVLAVGRLVLAAAGRAFSAQRELERVASLGSPHKVRADRRATTVRGRATLWIRDDLPASFEATPDEFALSLPGRSRTQLAVPAQADAARRILAGLRPPARAESAGDSGSGTSRCPVASAMHVYPNMEQLSEYAMLARTNRLSLMGVRRSRKIGQDHDFERLRDYTLDDNYKHIDWRATARRNKLTVKEYQTSQSQRIVFLLDCGRMMNTKSAGLSLLDHALNAMLMLGLRRPAAGRFGGPGLLLRSHPQVGSGPRRHEPDEPPAARVLRPLSATGGIAVRPGVSASGHAVPQTGAGRAGHAT